MAGKQDFIEFCDDFIGATAPDATGGVGSPWLIDDTSSGGSPAFTLESDNGGAFKMELASTTEVENVCLHFGDQLPFDIDKIDLVEFMVKTEATLDSATTLSIGVGSARADDPDSIAAAALFKLAGSNSIVVESDDGTTDNDDVATGKSLVDAYQRLVIDFSGGKSDVKFYVNGARVAAGTTFSMAAYSAGLQPIVQLQKTSDANTDSVSVDYIRVVCRR